MSMYENFHDILNLSKTPDELVDELRAAVVSARKDGESKEAILNELKLLYDVVDETKQDVIADVADFLYGWCSPHMKID